MVVVHKSVMLSVVAWMTTQSAAPQLSERTSRSQGTRRFLFERGVSPFTVLSFSSPHNQERYPQECPLPTARLRVGSATTSPCRTKPSFRALCPWLLGTLLAFGPTADIESQAEDQVRPNPHELEHVPLRLKSAEKTVEKRLLVERLGLHFYGFLDASYTQNFNAPSNRINELRIFDVNSNQFRPNLAQLVLKRDAKASGGWIDRTGFKLKFNAGRDSDFIGGTDLSVWADFQEFYVQYMAPIGGSLNLEVGQFNTLVGYEVVESPRNPNYSRSWLFGLGQPFTTRGMRASYEFSEKASLAVGVIEFINSARGNSEHSPLVEYALTLTPSESLKLTLYGLAGPREGSAGTVGGNLILMGGFLSMHLTDHASAVIEAYYANQANSSTISPRGNARWDGIAGYLLVDVTKRWGIRLRGEIFEDAGGYVSCQGTTTYQPRANVCFGATSSIPSPATAQTLWEGTVTLQYKPIPAVTARVEYRYDQSNRSVFQVGDRPSNEQSTLSFEVVWHF